MAGRVLHLGDQGPDVLALQQALNQRAETRFHPPVAADGQLGPGTLHAFAALGWALGLAADTVDASSVSIGAQDLVAHPEHRAAQQLERARRRAPNLHQRTIAFDGAPTFWGLAKALVRARERGWGGQLAASDRRPGVAERYGKKSQATLFACFERFQSLHRCPPECGGDCNPANPPGRSSHELCSDAAAFPGPAGRALEWWELGLDLSDSDTALTILADLGYAVRRTYPSSTSEHHHLNFTASPGPVLPSDGPAASGAHPAVPLAAIAHHPAAAHGTTVSLTGPDVSLNQPDVDWEQVKAAGHDFAIAKVSDGLNSPDPTFGKGRWKAMKDAGLVRGVYHFARPQRGRDPKDEVADFLGRLRDAGGLADGDLVPFLDVEAFGSAGSLTGPQTLVWLRGWVDEFRARTGRRPIIYTGSFWRDTVGNPPDDLGCRLWLAAYVPKAKLASDVPVAWHGQGPTLWQYTESGSCPGIAGGCDISRFDGRRGTFDGLRM